MKSERNIRIFPEKIGLNNQTALTELCIDRWPEEEIRWEINMNARLHRNYQKTPDLLVRLSASRAWVSCCLRFSFFLNNFPTRCSLDSEIWFNGSCFQVAEWAEAHLVLKVFTCWFPFLCFFSFLFSFFPLWNSVRLMVGGAAQVNFLCVYH